ncbi:hypothetical protein GCM10023148_37000 [Actinokineospora soli]
MRPRSRALTLLSAAALAGAVVAAPPAHAANLLTNPGFESGTLAGWSCSGATRSVVTSPVHAGTRALAGAATAADHARCDATKSEAKRS